MTKKINRWWVWFTDSQVLEYSLTFLDKRQHLYGLIAEYESVMKKKPLYSSLWMYLKLDCSSLTDSSKVLLTVPGVFFENCSWPLHRVLFITEPFVKHHGVSKVDTEAVTFIFEMSRFFIWSFWRLMMLKWSSRYFY